MSIFDIFSKDIIKLDRSLPLHLAIGKAGENEAVKYLRKNGYKIVDRNVHTGKSEIDIIAVKGETLVFDEVKTRTLTETDFISRPSDAVTKDKRSYLIRGVQKYCSEHYKEYGTMYKRIDITEVYLEKTGKKYRLSKIEHFENAVTKRR